MWPLKQAMLPLGQALIKQRFLRFLIVGGLNTAVGYLCYAAALGVLHLSLALALAVSWMIGVLFNFCSYGWLVFGIAPARDDHFGKRMSMLAKFVLIYVAGYGLNLGLLKGQAMALAALGLAVWYAPYITQLLALVIVVPVNYMLMRRFVWQSHATQH